MTIAMRVHPDGTLEEFDSQGYAAIHAWYDHLLDFVWLPRAVFFCHDYEGEFNALATELAHMHGMNPKNKLHGVVTVTGPFRSRESYVFRDIAVEDTRWLWNHKDSASSPSPR